MDQSLHASGIQEALKMEPFPSVMHAKSHDWTCQILWGGKWQHGAAKTTGEEMEQCNSYLSTTGSTTRNMSKGNREEQLTLHALHWNACKMQALPEHLMKWLVKARRLSKSCHEELKEMMKNFIPGMHFTKDKINSWHVEILATAEDDNQFSDGSWSDREIADTIKLRDKNIPGLFIKKLQERLQEQQDI